MLIDFHTHAFPDKIAPSAIEALKNGIIRQSGYVPEVYGDGRADNLRENMKKCGIDISVVLPVVTNPDKVESINNFARTLRGDGLISFAGVHPKMKNPIKTLDKIKEDGFIGIKLHPEFQECYVDESDTTELLRYAENIGLYAVMHTGLDVGIAPPYHSSPARLAKLLDRINGDKLILAHLGSFGMWEDVYKNLAGCNAYFDTAIVSGLIDKGLYRDIIKKHGADKVLLGSDFPWESPDMSYKALIKLGLDESEFKLICSENAKKILNIS